MTKQELRRNRKALVVLSGGQDSTTCLLWALAEFGSVAAVTFDYGQRHRVEIDAARKVAEVCGVTEHHVINVAGLLRSTSPLTSDAKLETYTDPEQMEAIIGDRVELTFVPMRNPVFLMVAANLAIATGADALVTGVCAMDNANYPDCTPSFVEAVAITINEALGRMRTGCTEPPFMVEAPLLYKTKAQTVAMALAYPLGREALSWSHTCYAGKVPPCGECHACVLRADGFAKAGVTDPLIERTQAEEELR